MRIAVTLLFLFAAPTVPVFSANFTYTGTISHDDDNRQFTFSLSKPASVVIRTYSYAGGLNAAGAQIQRGGFDPTLSIFDSSGNLIAVNRDGGCDHVSSDLITSFCFDSYIEQQFPAGTWRVVLTQSENTPNGPTLADSFCYNGATNFTSDPEGTNDQGFWDFFPNRRNGSYNLEIRGADASATPLDPAVAGIVNGGSFLAGSAAPNTILTLIDAQLSADPSVTITIGGINAEVLYAGGSQINFVVPPDAASGDSVPLSIWRGSNQLLAASLSITDGSPALFTSSQMGSGQAAVLNVMTNGEVTLNGSTAPAVAAARGTYISVFGTGFGAAKAADSSGLSWLAGAVTATLGNVAAQVIFAGLAPQSTKGLQQINVLIPEDAPTGSAVPIRLQIGAHATQPGTTIAIQ